MPDLKNGRCELETFRVEGKDHFRTWHVASRLEWQVAASGPLADLEKDGTLTLPWFFFSVDAVRGNEEQ